MIEWNDEDKQCLLAFKTVADCDDVRLKERVKDGLLNNRYIVHVLNNKELEDDEDAEPSDYFGINILPYYMLTPTQTNVQNYVCYEVSFEEVPKYNQFMKYCNIIFHILCENKNEIDSETGISRHDLLAALILDQYNWTNIFGMQFHCVEDKPSTVDSGYACRTLIFQAEIPNSVVKTKNNISRIINTSNTNGNLNTDVSKQ